MTTQQALSQAARHPTISEVLSEVGRDTAIPAIGLAPWGTHFCQFFSPSRTCWRRSCPTSRPAWRTTRPASGGPATR